MDPKEGEKPVIDFNLPGFIKMVESKGAEKAALDVVKDLLLLANKVITGRMS